MLTIKITATIFVMLLLRLGLTFGIVLLIGQSLQKLNWETSKHG